MNILAEYFKKKVQASSQHFQVALQVLDLRPSKLVRMVRTGWAMYQGRRLAPPPLFLHIEPTGACNLRCPSCPRTNAITRDMRHMSLEKFQRICDDVKPSFLAFVGFGEPLLNPALLDMVRYCVGKGITTRISTNATLLNTSLSRELIRSGLHQIWFSVDGPTRETFENARAGAHFDKTIAGIEEFTRLHTELKSNMVMTVNCTLTRNNIAELPAMIRFCHSVLRIQPSFARSYGYDLGLQQGLALRDTPDVMLRLAEGIRLAGELRLDAVVNNLKTIQTDLRHPLDGKGPCYFPYYTTAVSWDGKVTPCCLYYDYQMNFGNAMEQPFPKIWGNEKYQQFRVGLKTKRSQFPICNTCPLNDISLHNVLSRMSRVPGLGLLTREKFVYIDRPMETGNGDIPPPS